MKLQFENNQWASQADPFIFEDDGRFYLYPSGIADHSHGIGVYVSDSLTGKWQYKGVVTDFAEGYDFWAPSVIKIDKKYYMYVSCVTKMGKQFMHVACADSPLGPFTNEKCLYDHFSIDSHMVQTEAGLFLWYAKNNREDPLPGTRIYVDRFLDPYTPEHNPKEVLTPEFEEEKYTPNCVNGKLWYTLEGPFWFQEGEWQYLMYSAGCYQDDTYHIGYAVAKSDEPDLKKVEFVKVTDHGKFAPLIIKNEFEEGTGHHSVIKVDGTYYAIYHGRDYAVAEDTFVERRTARICKLSVGDGVITANRHPSHL